MTPEKAFALLQLDQNPEFDEIEDQFEVLLFDLKKYFIEKLPVEKLFLPKLNQARELISAFQLLTGKKDESFTVRQSEFFFGDTIEETFQTYHRLRNQLKQLILNTFSYPELEHYSLELVRLEKNYAGKWHQDQTDEKAVLIAIFPDSVALLKAIRIYAEKGNYSFSDLWERKNNPPEILLNEMKRLSLLYKKY